jgi:hypothetical protein
VSTLLCLTPFVATESSFARSKLPNLIVRKVSLPSQRAAPGDNIKTTDVTYNAGPSGAARSRTAYLLSADSRRSRSDLSLGARKVGRLGAGANSSGRIALKVPSFFPVGTYRIIACADFDRSVRERNERDNCRASGVLQLEQSGPTPPPPPPPPPPVDTNAPPRPVFAGSTPASGTDTATARLRGTAEQNATVDVFVGDACAGPPITTDAAAAFAEPGLVVPVGQGRTTSFTATATDVAGNVSGCASPLLFEEIALGEAEPNDDTAAAGDATRSFGVVFDRSRSFTGQVSSGSDIDLFEVRLAEPASLGLTVSGGSCALASELELTVLSASGTDEVASAGPGLSGTCPALTPTLPAGNHFVRVRASLGGEASPYVLTATLGPAAIPLETNPSSPSPDTAPRLTGQATPGATVDVFAKADCSGSPLATGTQAELASSGIPVPVPAGGTRVVRARARGGACSTQSVRYTNNSPPVDPPAPPKITAAAPASGADTASTRLSGSAPTGSTVRIFRSGSCAGQPIATVSSADFSAPGALVTVSQASVTTFTAQAVDSDSRASQCSSPFAFEEVAASEVEPNDDRAGADSAAAAFGVVIDRARNFAGQLAPRSERDLYRIAISRSATLTFAATAKPRCVQETDLRMSLLAADASTLLESADDSAGTACPLLSRTLAPGTYYLAIAANGSGSAFEYALATTEGPFAQPVATTPASPSSSTLPKVKGLATTGGAVQIFGTSDCTGAPLATADADDFASPGITVPVPFGSSRTFYARAVVDGTPGACSSNGVEYVNGTSEREPNDTTADAEARGADGVEITGSAAFGAELDPATDADVYAIHLSAETTLRLRTFDGDGEGCAAPVDTVMTLLAANGSERASNDDIDAANGQLCSRIEQRLTAGTYYVRIDNFAEGTPATYGYVLEATALPVATITATTPSSPSTDTAPRVIGTAPAGSTVDVFTRAKCAGTPAGTGSQATLTAPGIATLVGPNRRRPILTRAIENGVVGPCTDSGLTYESTAGRPATTRTEAEPNDTTAAADAQGFTASPGDVIAGRLASGDPPDLYRITTSAGPIRIETFDETAGDCPTTGFDTRLRLLTADGSVVASDDDGGIAFCDAIVRRVAAGMYYVEVVNTATGPAIDYRLALSRPSSAGSEPEMSDPTKDDNVPAHAVAISGHDTELNAGHPLAGDQDWYRISVPPAHSVRAEITEGDGSASTCEMDAIDSALTLFAPDGTAALATNDNGGGGLCSLIDGTGAAPADAGAYDLPAGDYYLRVTAAGEGDSPARSFDYRLNVVIR